MLSSLLLVGFQLAFLYSLHWLAQPPRSCSPRLLRDGPFLCSLFLLMGIYTGFVSTLFLQNMFDVPVPVRYKLVQAVVPIRGDSWKQ